jgi:hypothetical protein
MVTHHMGDHMFTTTMETIITVLAGTAVFLFGLGFFLGLLLAACTGEPFNRDQNSATQLLRHPQD